MNKVLLIIRDGWGYRKSCDQNAICQTSTPNTDKLMQNYPNTLLNASGLAVGVPEGFQGNSEVGHSTIGGGRIIFQSMDRINKAIEDKSFFQIPQFKQAIANCKKHKTHLHIIGLLQTEGVHAHINHLLALLDLCQKENFKNVYLHLITDGRDAPVHDSLKNLKTLEVKLKKLDFGQIATVGGRFYVMDRDKRWERTQKAYDCIVSAKTDLTFTSVRDYIKSCHSRKETDEFIVPAKAESYEGIKPNDSFIFYNFRTDRPRQLTQSMVEKNFDGFKVKPLPIYFVTMTNYYSGQNAAIAFADIPVSNFLGEYLSSKNKKQLRISETEKYAHVTFFFNGQIEKEYKGEDRIVIPSPKVETYDLKPEMSVYEIKDNLVKEIAKDKYDLIVTNLVNGDMVGHTGKITAIKKAVASIDDCLGQIVVKALEKNYTVLVFADHGNAEDQTPKWRTSHTTNPVPLILVSNDEKLQKIKLPKDKGLQDIAPTVLKLMSLPKPKEMTGESLI